MATGSFSVAQPDIRSKLLTFLRLGRPEYIVSHLYAFVPPYLATGEFHWPAFLAGVISCFINVPFSAFINNYADRVEDSVNFPTRVEMCKMVGYKNIRNVGLAFFTLSALWTLVFVYVSNVTVALIYLFGISIMMNYSWGLRLKRQPVLTSIVLALGFPVKFAGAWAMNRPLQTLPPVVLVLGYIMAIVGNLKNLPDTAGDKQAGVKTFFTGSFKIAIIGPFIWLSTYVLIVLLVLLRVLEPKYLIAFVTLPMALYGLWWTSRAQTVAEKEGVFRYSRLYRYVINGVVFLTFSPTVAVFVALLLLVALNYAVSYAMDPERFNFGGIYSR